MIDFDEMQKYLEARRDRKYFIPPAKECYFDHSSVQVLAFLVNEFGIAEVTKCFQSNELGKSSYPIELPCATCCAMIYVHMSKTSLLDILKSGAKDDRNFQKYECAECKAQSDEKRRQEETEQKEKCIGNRIENTKKYIEGYLDPNKSWNSGIKTYEKWNCIIQYNVDEHMIAEHIKGMPYYDFLKTPYWKAIAEKKRGQAKFKCQLCNCEGKLATHHRTYDFHGYEHSHLQDLIVLCDVCHSKFHNKVYDGNT